MFKAVPQGGADRGDGDAYVYVLAKTPTSPSVKSRAQVPAGGTSPDGIPESAQTSLTYGPGVYQVDPWVTDRHNLRAAPRLRAMVVGNLFGGDVVDVASVIMVPIPGGDREHWAQLVRKTPGPAAWTLLAGNGGIRFLRYLKRGGPGGAKPNEKGRPQIAPLDRAIAEQLGHPELDDTEVADLIERIVEHEFHLGGEEALVESMKVAKEEADAKSAAKREELERNAKAADAKKEQQARYLAQREAWEQERPKLGVRGAKQLAALDDSCQALDAELEERLRQLREKRATELAVELASDPTSWMKDGSSKLGSDPDEDAPGVEENAAASLKAAKAASSRAAQRLAGVSDAPLAQALISMQAASALYYRNKVYSN